MATSWLRRGPTHLKRRAYRRETCANGNRSNLQRRAPRTCVSVSALNPGAVAAAVTALKREAIKAAREARPARYRRTRTL